MSDSKNGSDPKGKSVETTVTFSSPRVLLVDDSPYDRYRTSMYLLRHKVQVIVFHGARQALEFMNMDNEVNLILTVDDMPHMSGYDLLMEIKKSPKLNHLPVVILSTEKIPERVKKCFDGGAKDYIKNPIKYADVPSILNYI